MRPRSLRSSCWAHACRSPSPDTSPARTDGTCARRAGASRTRSGPRPGKEYSMGVLDRFEKGVDRYFSAAFAKAFRSEVKPVEIASAVRREMDDRAAPVSRGRTVVPNEFTVELSNADHQQVTDFGADALADEMVEVATEHAASQRYSFVGPVEVHFIEDEALSTGRFTVRSATRRGAVAPATAAKPSSRHPIIDIDGERYLLTGPVTVIGRGSEADVVVDDTGVSRRHLEI